MAPASPGLTPALGARTPRALGAHVLGAFWTRARRPGAEARAPLVGGTGTAHIRAVAA